MVPPPPCVRRWSGSPSGMDQILRSSLSGHVTSIDPSGLQASGHPAHRCGNARPTRRPDSMSQTWIVSRRPTASRRLPGWNTQYWRIRPAGCCGPGCRSRGHRRARSCRRRGVRIIRRLSGLNSATSTVRPRGMRPRPRRRKTGEAGRGQPPGPEAMVVPGRQVAAVGAEPQEGDSWGNPSSRWISLPSPVRCTTIVPRSPT